MYVLDPATNQITFQSRKTAKGLEQKISGRHCLPDGMIPFGSDNNQSLLAKIMIPFDRDPYLKPFKQADMASCGAAVVSGFPVRDDDGTLVHVIACLPHVLPAVQVVDPVNLKPLALLRLSEIEPQLEGTHLCSPHMAKDEESGEWFGCATQTGWSILAAGMSSMHNVFAVHPNGKTRILAKIPVYSPSIIHSVAVTENFVIVVSVFKRSQFSRHLNPGLPVPLVFLLRLGFWCDSACSPARVSLFSIQDGSMVHEPI
jgi:hypothetical protein